MWMLPLIGVKANFVQMQHALQELLYFFKPRCHPLYNSPLMCVYHERNKSFQ